MTEQPIIHPARAMPFDDLVAGLERARAAGHVSRKTCAETGLHLYCYTQRCVYDQAWDAYSLMARGLIVDPAARRVEATPFPKFFNLGEGGRTAPAGPFEAYDKLDGSLIIAFYFAGRWRAATKGAFDSSQAAWAQARLDAMDTRHLAPGATYLFEAIYPENVIVVRYPVAGLYLLAAYHESGVEMDYCELSRICIATGLPLVASEGFDSIADMVRTATTLPGDKEGFVVRFEDGSRLKIKGDEYKRLHGLISRCTPLAVWEILAAGGNPDAMRRELPEEFWADFDQIYGILAERFLDLLGNLLTVAGEVSDLSARELGLRLLEMPADVRPFLFAYRKADTPEAEAKVTQSMLKTIRPTGNVLAGYVPSYAMARALDEAA
ncbi:MAG: RNA ligase [Methylobacterium radiotolerans]